jgi:hypothetical protein
MKLEELRDIAKSHGINHGKLTKADLIKSIQASEGNFACFGTASDGACDQAGCTWRKDCFVVSLG